MKVLFGSHLSVGRYDMDTSLEEKLLFFFMLKLIVVSSSKINRSPDISPAKMEFFIQNQKRIAIQDLQPWQATCKFFHGKGGTAL